MEIGKRQEEKRTRNTADFLYWNIIYSILSEGKHINNNRWGIMFPS